MTSFFMKIIVNDCSAINLLMLRTNYQFGQKTIGFCTQLINIPLLMSYHFNTLYRLKLR